MGSEEIEAAIDDEQSSSSTSQSSSSSSPSGDSSSDPDGIPSSSLVGPSSSSSRSAVPSRATLLNDLSALTLGALKRRARKDDIPQEKLAGIDDEDDPREALMELIMDVNMSAKAP